MAWTVTAAGSWSIAVTDTTSVMAAALALPGSWPIGLQPALYVRRDQVANLPLPGPPVAGYSAWYDASQIAGISDGAALSTWPDLSGHGYDLASTAQPTFYKTTSAQLINGKPVVQFTPNQWIRSQAAGLLVAQPFTVVTVFRYDGLVDGSYLWSSNAGGVGVFLSGGALTVYAGGSQISAATANTTSAHFLACVMSGAASINRYDATASATYNPGAGGMVNRLGFANNDNPPSAGANVRLAEMLVYPSALSAANLTALRSYAQAKWGTP